jgi:hypothetical protein
MIHKSFFLGFNSLTRYREVVVDAICFLLLVNMRCRGVGRDSSVSLSPVVSFAVRLSLGAGLSPRTGRPPARAQKV